MCTEFGRGEEGDIEFLYMTALLQRYMLGFVTEALFVYVYMCWLCAHVCAQHYAHVWV